MTDNSEHFWFRIARILAAFLLISVILNVKLYQEYKWMETFATEAQADHMKTIKGTR